MNELDENDKKKRAAQEALDEIATLEEEHKQRVRDLKNRIRTEGMSTHVQFSLNKMITCASTEDDDVDIDDYDADYSMSEI